MPVPSVVTMTRPVRPLAAPYRTSARPAASASLTTWTSRPVALVISWSASSPIQCWSMLAAECTSPPRTIPGTVTPTGPSLSGNDVSSSTKTWVTASGVEGLGVSIRTRSAANSPFSRSTGAPLIPLPPKSIPIGNAAPVAVMAPISRVPATRGNLPTGGSLARQLYKSYGDVNLALDQLDPARGGGHVVRHREQHRAPRLHRGVAGPEAVSLADRPGRSVAGLHRHRDVAPDRLGRVVLDRPGRDPDDRPGHRPARRARPLQPAGRRHRGAREGPVLPLDHLSLSADPVRRVRRRDVPRDPGRPRPGRQGRHRDLHRLHRWDRHQHRPRARPQEGGQRALAVEDRARPELLRPLLHRAQPRSPRPRRDPGGSGLEPDGRELLPVLAADGRGLAEERVEPRAEALRPQAHPPVPPRQRRPPRL